MSITLKTARIAYGWKVWEEGKKENATNADSLGHATYNHLKRIGVIKDDGETITINTEMHEN